SIHIFHALRLLHTLPTRRSSDLLDTFDNHYIEITSNSPEIGNVKEQLSAISVEGEALKISFSSKYLLETLRTIDAETVQINRNRDRKSTRLNSSHVSISYAVFCL